jgi:hypothetical protein
MFFLTSCQPFFLGETGCEKELWRRLCLSDGGEGRRDSGADALISGSWSAGGAGTFSMMDVWTSIF